MSDWRRPALRQSFGLEPSPERGPQQRMRSTSPEEPLKPRTTRSVESLSQEPEPVIRQAPPKSSPHKPTFLELHKTPIQIFVAEDGIHGHSFYTHVELICYYSKFFRLQFAIKREETQYHVLEDVHPDEFAIFYRWMESKQLFESDAEKKDWKMLSLAKLHNTAMRIEAPMFANVILEAINHRIVLLTQSVHEGRMRKFDSSLKTIRWITREVPLDCRLYHYARDYMTYFYLLHVPELNADALADFPTHFIGDLMFTLRDAMHRLSPFQGARIAADNEADPRRSELYAAHYIDMVMVMAGALKGLIRTCPTERFTPVDNICHYHVHERQDPPSKRCAKKPVVGFWEDMAMLLNRTQVHVEIIE